MPRLGSVNANPTREDRSPARGHLFDPGCQFWMSAIGAAALSSSVSIGNRFGTPALQQIFYTKAAIRSSNDG
jgi:hypothetical protein